MIKASKASVMLDRNAFFAKWSNLPNMYVQKEVVSGKGKERHVTETDCQVLLQ
jgi:hypothetical protein